MRRAYLVAMVLSACAHAPGGTRLAATVRVCEPGARACIAPDELRCELATAPLDVRAAHELRHGLSHPEQLSVAVEGGIVRVKWKEAGHHGDGHNRSPRHELAVQAVAQLLLEHPEEVVPPTVVRCLDAREYQAAFHRPMRATFPGVDCRFGTLAYWLEDVEELHGLDRARYAADPAYRDAIARLNLVTYVVDHRDTKDDNFVITRAGRAGAPVHAFSVDNGLAFSGVRTLRGFFVEDWARMRVPALPRETLERLRRITRADLDRLAVVAQLEVRDGRLVPVPPGPPLDPELGVRRFADTIQLGLTREEIDGVERRIHQILALESAGRLAAFDGVASKTQRATEWSDHCLPNPGSGRKNGD